MKKLARKAADSPAMQQAAGAAQAQAANLARSAKDKAMQRVPRLTEKAKSTMSGPIGGHIPGLRARDANGHSEGDSYTTAPGAPETGSSPPSWPPQGQEACTNGPPGGLAGQAGHFACRNEPGCRRLTRENTLSRLPCCR